MTLSWAGLMLMLSAHGGVPFWTRLWSVMASRVCGQEIVGGDECSSSFRLVVILHYCTQLCGTVLYHSNRPTCFSKEGFVLSSRSRLSRPPHFFFFFSALRFGDFFLLFLLLISSILRESHQRQQTQRKRWHVLSSKSVVSSGSAASGVSDVTLWLPAQAPQGGTSQIPLLCQW